MAFSESGSGASPKSDPKGEYGDFQTPLSLADEVCGLVRSHAISPRSLVEPTFGQGSFLESALKHFPRLSSIYGLEINEQYLSQASERVANLATEANMNLELGDFFTHNWAEVLSAMPEPVLIIGNLPWVTNSQLSSLDSTNLPQKSNFKRLRGFDALTGKSNFDISEWMMLHLIQSTLHKACHIALLCKTSVARSALEHCWRNKLPVSAAALYLIDAKTHFGASVDACLLSARIGGPRESSCTVFSSLSRGQVLSNFGYVDGILVADVVQYEAAKHLAGETSLRWRSGIKHDAAKVMELTADNVSLINGFGEKVEIEIDYLYPMLKSSDIANSSMPVPSRWMLVPQAHLREPTDVIQATAPRTWEYLTSHSDILDGRKSSIYVDAPRFAVFGVGDYSFLPWKVAISGLYKSINFCLIGPHMDKPTVLDDTCYFLSFQSERQAQVVYDLLRSPLAASFFEGYIFWDNKRPITAKLLNKLDLSKLADALGMSNEYAQFIQPFLYARRKSTQMTLLEANE